MCTVIGRNGDRQSHTGAIRHVRRWNQGHLPGKVCFRDELGLNANCNGAEVQSK